MAKRDSTLIRAFQNISDNRQWEQVYLPYFKVESRKGDWLNGNCPLSKHGGNDKNPSFGVNIAEGSD